MEETLIEEDIDISIEEAHEAAPEWIYKEKEVCPICGRTDCAWNMILENTELI